ncbi:Non-catalytic module family DOC2, partial [Piromyces sp. E2]
GIEPEEPEEPEQPACSSVFIEQGYKCCAECGEVYYTDDAGYWSVENNEWCGLPESCF